MKKILSLALAGLAACTAFMTVGCDNREAQLKLYIPGEYMDYSILDEFESWYTEQTGNTIKVVTPNTFDVVEDVLMKVENKADYDLLCPSDYAVERLINRGLLQKVDKDIIDVEPLLKPEYVKRAKISDPDLEYSVPYIYGTFGIMYDYSKTGAHIDSWDAIFTDAYSNVCANKDSLREAMTSAAIYANRSTLFAASNGFTEYSDEFNSRLQAIYNDTSDAAIDTCVATLRDMKSHIKEWGGESLKFDMAAGNTDIKVALMWSCDAGYVMNDYEDDDGNEHIGNRNMWYVVPKEGGNIYLDNFCISKYAKNVEAANYFLKFLCTKDVALKNSRYAGAISPIAAAYDELYEEYTTDTSYEEQSGKAWRDMYIDMLFPSETTLRRCGVMRDYGAANEKFSSSWANVRY